MRTLWHCVNARSFRPLWMLEELGLDYTLKILPFPPRAFAKHYFDENPLGTVPLYVEGETRMTESSAICQFLADRHPRKEFGVAVSDPAYGAYLNALHHGEATLTFPQTLVLRYRVLEPEERKQPQVADDYVKWFNGRLKLLNALLGGADFMAANRFTAADISVGYALMLAHSIGLDADFAPQVKAYWARLSARDGFARALARQDREAKAQAAGPAAPVRTP